jgi:outer membrane protein assembly factor BamA
MVFVVFIFLLPGEVSGSSFFADSTFKVGDIKLEGNIVFSEKLIRNLLPKKGTDFNEELFEENIERIVSFYLDRGFPFARIKPLGFSSDSIYINWELLIEPGSLQRINNIFVEGLSYTDTEFFKRKILIDKNDIFSDKEIKEAVLKLDKLNYINIDSFTVKPGADRSLVDIIIYLKENTDGNFNGAVSYAKNGGFSGALSFSNTNLFGRGRKVEIELEKQGEEYQAELFEYTEPDILYLPVNLNFSLNHNYIRDNYNLFSFSSGVEYFYNDASFLSRLGFEIFSGQDSSETYPFLDVGFSYNSNTFDIFYKERFRKGKGWDLKTSVGIYFLPLVIKLEYFKLSFLEGNLIFYKSFRGYPGMIIKEGAVVGLELRKGFGPLTVYPFVDANYFNNKWQYSYGFGLSIKRFSLEYAVPKGIPPSEGRIYFRFDAK